MEAGDHQLLTGWMRFPNGQIRHQLGWAFGLDSHACSMIAAIAKAERGKKIDLGHKSTLALLHRQENFLAMHRNFGRPSTAGQPDFWGVVITDNRRIQVGKLVDLRPPKSRL